MPLKKLILAIAILLNLPFSARTQSHHENVSPFLADRNSFTILSSAKPVAYDRMIFGLFIEHFHREIYGGIFEPGSKLSDENGFRKDVIDAMKELKVPIVRWPGGCFASSYHWLNGVGSKRQPDFDKAWQVEEPNTFGTDEFVLWCKKIGAEPFICSNAGTGSSEEMSNWVEYCNLDAGRFGRLRHDNGHAQPYNVKFWSIGNENWGSHEMGAKAVTEWGPLVRESAKMMRRVSPDLRLFAAALPQKEWTLPLLKVAGDYLDYVSIHNYWDGDHEHLNPASYMDCMMKTSSIEAEIKRTIEILDESGYRDKIKIAFDEWNLRAWLHPGLFNSRAKMDIKARDNNDINSTYTMADALFSACFLNTCLRNARDVKMACLSPAVNAAGALYVYTDGLVKRSTFYVLALYANQLKKNIVKIKTTSEILRNGHQSTPALDVVLTCDDNKTHFVLAAVNKNPTKEMVLRLDFKQLGLQPSKQIKGMVLSGKSQDDYNDVGRENNVIPFDKTFEVSHSTIKIPAHSLVILHLE